MSKMGVVSARARAMATRSAHAPESSRGYFASEALESHGLEQSERESPAARSP
jgi:hypothetical protein